MSGATSLCVWALLLVHATPALCNTPQFLYHEKGESVVLSCRVNQTTSPPIGVYLKRSWLRTKEVLFKYQHLEVSVLDKEFKNRTSVSGDPSVRALNITISDLRPSDTDRYHCEFSVHNEPEDTVQRGDRDFFLLVRGVPDVNRDLIEACVGSSVVLPCVPPVGDSSAVEGVVLKRQRGQQPMELLYHSKHTTESPELSMNRFELSTAPGPGGISYSLKVGDLQPEDSGLYSCQLLLHGRNHSPSMGHGTYISVQGDQCGCSSYSTLIYALSAAVAITLFLLLMVVLMQRGKRRRATVKHTPAPIYEEMSGLQTKSPTRSRNHTDEAQSEYRNISPTKLCPENHYESPNEARSTKSE